MLQGADHVAHEALGVNIGNTRFGIAFLDQMRDRVHQVGLAQTNTTVEEQRVVRPPRVFGHLQRCGFRELVALALDERAEREVGLKTSADHEAVRSSRACGQDYRSSRFALRDHCARADFNRHYGNVAATLVTQQLADSRQQVGIYPVDDESIRRKQLQRTRALQDLQRTHPGIELLLRKLSLQGADALSPMRRFHALPPRPPRRDLEKRAAQSIPSAACAEAPKYTRSRLRLRNRLRRCGQRTGTIIY